MSSTLTLCFIKEDNQVLLGMKKRGFGAGRWNGFGGKVAANETIQAAAIRELEEEASVRATRVKHHGTLTFRLQGRGELQVHVFRVLEYTGEPIETEEMRPQWFAFDAIPYGEMWDDDRYWLPHLLKGEQFTGTFYFDEKERVTDWELQTQGNKDS